MRSQHMSVTRRGGPETLQLMRGQTPEPATGEVVVRIEAAGVSYGDLLQSRGVIPGGPKPPFTPGFDLTGVIEQLGAGVAGLAIGQPVLALVRTGGYADRIVLPAERVVPRPPNVGAVEAAAAALNYFIAYQMLHRVAQVQPGQQILVHGASGGVGLAFVQLAALAGVECYGSASAANLGVVTKYGGHAFDYLSQDFVELIRASPQHSVHAVFDPIGGRHFNRSYSVLRRGGILVAYGQNAALSPAGKAKPATGAWGFLGGIVAPKLIPDGRRTTFYNAWSLEKRAPQAYREDLTAILQLLSERKIEPVIAETLDLADAARAQSDLESHTLNGKIVLTNAN